MKLEIKDPNTGEVQETRLWGVTFVPAKSRQRTFCNKHGEYNHEAFEHAMENQTDIMLNGGLDPMQNIRRAHYITQIFILNKVRYVGLRHTPRKAARLFDSALFHLWGFLKNPKASRFNYLDVSTAASNPPEEGRIEIASLRKALILELSKEGTDPTPFNRNFAQCMQAEADVKAAEEKRKADKWEEMQRKHL